MKRPLVLLALLTLLAVPCLAATPDEEVRAAFDRFVKAQNAHDAKAVSALLVDSPKFLWITRGHAVWGRAEAMRVFQALWAGTWHLKPDSTQFRVLFSQPKAAEIYVPVLFTVGAPGQPAQDAMVHLNQVLVKTDSGWKIQSILPMPAQTK